MKYIILVIVTILFILIIGAGFYYFLTPTATVDNLPVAVEKPTPVVATSTIATTTEELPIERGPETVIGTSVKNNAITAYHFGQGKDEIVFIGGIHGGYSWNTSLVAYELIDYLKANSTVVPENITVTVIPILNPDGLESITGKIGRFVASDITANQAEQTAGRYNANQVDLNRNFNCQWQPTGKWQNKTVSGGSNPFSEPETKAIEKYTADNTPVAVVTWYSAAGGVYSSNCENGVLPETAILTNLYAKASGYKDYQEFDYYEITGDMVNWFASQNIPAISVLLSNHTDTEWTKNLAGVEAVIKHFQK